MPQQDAGEGGVHVPACDYFDRLVRLPCCARALVSLARRTLLRTAAALHSSHKWTPCWDSSKAVLEATRWNWRRIVSSSP